MIERGPLILPAFSWKDPPNTCVGFIPEHFRTRYATKRSDHPTHSFCGTNADQYLDGCDSETPFGANSPLGRLCRDDGFVLMAGVGFDCCSLIHHVEEMVAPEIYLDGAVHRKLRRDYWKVEDMLAERGQLNTYSVGNAVFMLFSALDLYNAVFSLLSRDKWGLVSETRYRWM